MPVLLSDRSVQYRRRSIEILDGLAKLEDMRATACLPVGIYSSAKACGMILRRYDMES